MRALFDPVDGMAAGVAAKRWVVPLLLLTICVAGSGAAYAVRWNGGPSVIRQLQAEGELATTTEQEIAEAITTAQRVRLVKAVAIGLFLVPVAVLGLATLLKLCGWLFAASAPFVRCLAAAALGLLPVAIYHAIFAACALRQPVLGDADDAGLVPSSLAALFPALHPPLHQALAGADFFGLWTALLLGLGFAAASGMRRPRALALSFTLYLLFVGVAQVGLPGLIGGRG